MTTCFSLITLAASSGKRNVTFWRPSVCLSVPIPNLNMARGAYLTWLTRRHHATRPAYISVRVLRGRIYLLKIKKTDFLGPAQMFKYYEKCWKTFQVQTRRSVLLIVGPKCMLAALHAGPGWVTLSMCAARRINVRKKDGTEKQTDGQTDGRCITLTVWCD